jgi:hypothetical protein
MCADINPDLWDPNCYRGYYLVPAVPLARRSRRDRQREDGFLLWYPKYSKFGQWDSEHDNAIHFGETTWSNIVANPIRYLNQMWEWNEQDPIFHRVTPWLDGSFEFHEE